MKYFSLLFALFLSISASAQGPARRLESITQLLQIDPLAVATGDELSYIVAGYTSSNIWLRPRVCRWDRTSTETANGVSVFNTISSGRWIFDDVAQGIVDVSWANAIGDGTTDDTAPMQLAFSLAKNGWTITAPPGKTYKITDSLVVMSNRVNVELNWATLKFVTPSRKAALRVGPSAVTLTNLNYTLDTATNRVVGAAASFTAGDLVYLYNLVESPAGYYPGQMAFVSAVDGSDVILDRFPDTAMSITNAVRYQAVPTGVTIRHLSVDLSNNGDNIGISATGKNCAVDECSVYGTQTVGDQNYIGIELRGQSMIASRNRVAGILDTLNVTDRAGYGIFGEGDGIIINDNDVWDCKHCISTSARKAISPEISIVNNRIRQRFDWAGLQDAMGNYLFTGALDVHANVRHVEIRNNDILIGGRWALSLRNGNYDVLYNTIKVVQQSGLPFSQHGSAISEAFVTHGNFVGNEFTTPTNTIHLYFDRADSGVSGTHSNLTFTGNIFRDAILSFDDTSVTCTNPIIGLTIIGNVFERGVGTPVIFNGAISNAIFSGNLVSYGAGSGITVAMPGTDATTSAREIYIGGNTFKKWGGTGYDIDVQSGPTNVIELAQNRFSSSPTRGFSGSVAVSRTPPSSYRYQLIEADDQQLIFNNNAGTTPARLRGSGIESLLGYYTEFISERYAGTDRAFSTIITNQTGRSWVVRADGLMSWSDGTNSASMTLGPQRIEDRMNGVLRLSGSFGLTEKAQPPTPQTTTATIWLESASGYSTRILWPNGVIGYLWNSQNHPDAPTNSNYYARRSGAWDVLGNMAGIDDAISDGNSYLRKNGSWTAVSNLVYVNDAPADGSTYGRNNNAWTTITATTPGAGTNLFLNNVLKQPARLTNSTTVTWTVNGNGDIEAGVPVLTYTDGVTNGSGTIKGNYYPGGNVYFVTNAGGVISINSLVSTNINTNGWQIAVDSSIVLTPNLQNSSEIDPTASGTNILFSLIDGSVATNKISAGFHSWVESKQDALTFNDGVQKIGSAVSANLAAGSGVTISNSLGQLVISATGSAASSNAVRVDGTIVTNIKTSSDISFTTASLEATPALTTTAVTPGTYSNATVTVDSKGRITAASITPQPARTLLSVNNSAVSPDANLQNSTQINFSATGSNITATIPDGSITTNKINFTSLFSSPILGKASWTANPHSVSDVTDLRISGCVTNVTFTGLAGPEDTDYYKLDFSSNIGTNYNVIVTCEGYNSSATIPYGGVKAAEDGSWPLATDHVEIFRHQYTGDTPLDDGYRIWVIIMQ